MLVNTINPFQTNLKSSTLLHPEFSVLFFCGSLEKGKDGVGDYIVKLAVELERRGCKPAILAYNDCYIKAPLETLNLQDEPTQLAVLRLPFGMSSSEKKLLCIDFVRKLNPTIISLQFVPYSFNAKGIPLGLPKALMNLNKDKARWHIMFHEIWLADTQGWKQRVAKFAQRLIIKNLVKRLQPVQIHCSIESTKQKLSGVHIDATILPLFGNIAYDSYIDDSLKNLMDSYSHRILYFGAVPREEVLKKIVNKLRPLSIKMGKSLCIVVVGKNSSAKTDFLKFLGANLSESTGIIDAGFLEEKSIAYLMQVCTIGISRLTPELLGKSGTAIAMLEYGLPIWMPQVPISDSIEFHFRSGLIFSDPAKALSYKEKAGYQSLLPVVASQFIKNLQNQLC